MDLAMELSVLLLWLFVGSIIPTFAALTALYWAWNISFVLKQVQREVHELKAGLLDATDNTA